MKITSIFFIAALYASNTLAQTDPLDGAKKKIAAKNLNGAKPDLTKYIESNPRTKEAFTCRGQVGDDLQDYYGGIGDSNFALELDSTYSDSLNARGEAKITLGDDEGAIRDLDKAIKFNPKFTDAYAKRGFAKYNHEDLQGAYFG